MKPSDMTNEELAKALMRRVPLDSNNHDDIREASARLRKQDIIVAAQSVTNCNRLGNVAKMREALEKANATLSLISKSAWFIDANFAVTKAVIEAGKAIQAALSAPPRNCDRFATAKDAFAELDKLCEKTTCGYCRFRKHEGFECMFAWLYEETKGGAK